MAVFLAARRGARTEVPPRPATPEVPPVRPVPVVPPTFPSPEVVRVHPPTIAVDPRWEYRHIERVLETDGVLGQDELSQLGADGWELVAAMTHDGVAHYYLKRAAR